MARRAIADPDPSTYTEDCETIGKNLDHNSTPKLSVAPNTVEIQQEDAFPVF